MRADRPYLLALMRAMLAPSRRSARLAFTLPAVVAVAATCAALYPPPVRPESGEGGAQASHVAALSDRLLVVGERLSAVERHHAREVAPIERTLLAYRNDSRLARRIALSLVREGRRTGLEPRLLLAVMLVENPWLDPAARSPVGAIGLMQVMPLHQGHWSACKPRLDEIEANICHGAAIFANYLEAESGNVERALLRYNGCVRGTNTPDCHAYASSVFQRAGRASVLAWLRQGTAKDGSLRDAPRRFE